MPRGSSRAGRKPDYKWTGLDFDLGSLTSGSNVLTSIATWPFQGSVTLMRVRGTIAYNCLGASTVGFASVSFGLIVVTDEAFTAGVASVPDPRDAPEADWLWKGQLYTRAESTTTATIRSPVAVVEVDSKAMRKAKDVQRLVLVTSPLTLTGTLQTEVAGEIRALIAS